MVQQHARLHVAQGGSSMPETLRVVCNYSPLPYQAPCAMLDAWFANAWSHKAHRAAQLVQQCHVASQWWQLCISSKEGSIFQESITKAVKRAGFEGTACLQWACRESVRHVPG